MPADRPADEAVDRGGRHPWASPGGAGAVHRAPGPADGVPSLSRRPPASTKPAAAVIPTVHSPYWDDCSFRNPGEKDLTW